MGVGHKHPALLPQGENPLRRRTEGWRATVGMLFTDSGNLHFTWNACVTKYSSCIFFPSHLKMVQTILSSWAVRRQVAGWMGTASCRSFSQHNYAGPWYTESSLETLFKVRSFSPKRVNAEGNRFLENLSHDAPLGLLGPDHTFRPRLPCLGPAASQPVPAHPRSRLRSPAILRGHRATELITEGCAQGGTKEARDLPSGLNKTLQDAGLHKAWSLPGRPLSPLTSTSISRDKWLQMTTLQLPPWGLTIQSHPPPDSCIPGPQENGRCCQVSLLMQGGV